MPKPSRDRPSTVDLASAAVGWALERVGQPGYALRCLAFVEDALERPNGIEIFGGSSAAESAAQYGLHPFTPGATPPAGSFVFYDAEGPIDGTHRSWGHVGLSLGDGRVVHTWDVIRIDDARAVLHAGADKVSVNTPALDRPDLIGEIADAFGVQCVVVGIDSLRDDDGQWRVRQYTGDPSRTRALSRRTLDWVVEAQERGAGEIVLNCMGSDGVRSGYDLEQLRAVRDVCRVPLVASGGAGTIAHFVDVFRQADVDAALAASVFHSGAVAIAELKNELAAQGVEVRRD